MCSRIEKLFLKFHSHWILLAFLGILPWRAVLLCSVRLLGQAAWYVFPDMLLWHSDLVCFICLSVWLSVYLDVSYLPFLNCCLDMLSWCVLTVVKCFHDIATILMWLKGLPWHTDVACCLYAVSVLFLCCLYAVSMLSLCCFYLVLMCLNGSDKIFCCLQTQFSYPRLPTKYVATYCLQLYKKYIKVS